jgi:uncharacterized coiled-coil DUF342 family protein
MELSSQASSRVDLDGYRTPLGKLARRFKASVELWKSKYQGLQRQIKRFQNRAADARRSRDRWKEQAKHWKATAQQLQDELDRLRAETGDPTSKRTMSS